MKILNLEFFNVVFSKLGMQHNEIVIGTEQQVHDYATCEANGLGAVYSVYKLRIENTNDLPKNKNIKICRDFTYEI